MINKILVTSDTGVIVHPMFRVLADPLTEEQITAALEMMYTVDSFEVDGNEATVIVSEDKCPDNSFPAVEFEPPEGV